MALEQEKRIIKDGTWKLQTGTDTPPEDSDF